MKVTTSAYGCAEQVLMIRARAGVRSRQADGCDGLVVVPFGARELAAVWVYVLLPCAAVLEKGGQPSLVGASDGVPVVEAEALDGVGRSVGGQDDPLKRRHGQGESDRIPGRFRVGGGNPVAAGGIATCSLAYLEFPENLRVSRAVARTCGEAFTVEARLRQSEVVEPVVGEDGRGSG